MCLTPFKSTTTTCNSRERGANLPPVFSLTAFFKSSTNVVRRSLVNKRTGVLNERKTETGPNTWTIADNSNATSQQCWFCNFSALQTDSSQMCCRVCRCAVPLEERLLSPCVSTKSLVVSLLLSVTAGHVPPRCLEGFPLGFGWFRDIQLPPLRKDQPTGPSTVCGTVTSSYIQS